MVGRKGGAHNRPGRGNVQRLVDRRGYVSFRGRVRLDQRTHYAQAVGAGIPSRYTKRQWELVEREAEEQARRLLDALIADLTAGREDNASKRRATLAEWLAVWGPIKEDELPAAVGTWVRYEVLLRRHVTPFIGGVRLAALSPSVVVRWRKELRGHEEPRSTTLVQQAERVLRMALRDAPAYGYTIDQSILTMSRLADPSAAADEEKGLSPAQFKLIYERSPEPWRTRWLFLYGTACRVGEARGARWGSVLWTSRQVNVNGQLDRLGVYRLPKYGSTGTVDVSDELLTALTALRKERESMLGRPVRPDEYLFLDDAGRPPSYRAWWAAFHRDTEAVGIAGATIHHLRHGAGQLMAEVEASPLGIQQQMRHGKFSTTERYLRRKVVSGRATADKAAERLRQELDKAPNATA